MIRLGIIGSIGSGKSFVSKLFKYPVFNADDEVKYLYKNNMPKSIQDIIKPNSKNKEKFNLFEK